MMGANHLSRAVLKERHVSTDRMIGLAGLVIGLLGLIPIFRDASAQVRSAYLVALALALALFVLTVINGRGPNYKTLLVRKVLTVFDTGGKLAEIRSEQTIRVRYGSLEGVWWNGLTADGTFSDPKANGKAPTQSKRFGPTLSYYHAFKPPLSRGETKTVVWSIKTHDSFTNANEALLHDTTPWTKRLIMEVNLPEGRPAKNPKLHVEVAGSYTETLDDPRNNGNGRQLVAEVNRPKQGHTYSLDWEW